MRLVVDTRGRERGVGRGHVDDPGLILTQDHTALGLAVGLLQGVLDVAEGLGHTRAVRGVGDRPGTAVEVHHQAVVHRVEGHLHRRREVAGTAALTVGVLDGESAAGLERRGAVGLRQRDVLFERRDEREHLERRPGLQARLGEVPAARVVTAVVTAHPAGLRIDGYHRREQIIRFAVQLTFGALVDPVLAAGRLDDAVLDLRVDRGADLETTGPQLLVGDADAVQLGEDLSLDEAVGPGGLVGVADTRLDGLGEDRVVGLRAGDRTGRDHAVEDVTPARFGDLTVGVRVVVGRCADDRRQQRGLFEGERVALGATLVGDRLVEELLRGHRDAVGAPAEVDRVEVCLEDLLLRPAVPVVHLRGDRELFELPGVADLVTDDRVLDVLLRDGRATAGGLVAGDLTDGSAGQAAGREAVVGPELPVLGGDDRLLHRLGDLVERDDRAVAVGRGDVCEGPPGRVDDGGLLAHLRFGDLGSEVGGRERDDEHQHDRRDDGAHDPQRPREPSVSCRCLTPVLTAAARTGSDSGASRRGRRTTCLAHRPPSYRVARTFVIRRARSTSLASCRSTVTAGHRPGQKTAGRRATWPRVGSDAWSAAAARQRTTGPDGSNCRSGTPRPRAPRTPRRSSRAGRSPRCCAPTRSPDRAGRRTPRTPA